ncbi:3-oxoacyl-(acyl-carrier-protein) synthase/NAD(P)-dependent dehydrogenase (short-subunit alcohol dehydrogenase family)/aryl carrier-like protein, partial [Xanthomonas arboricola]|nr:3-oxoacyl-(acyl-carrier-protein) synthase/NAD(P)-dependent dehydrogenase (short-subunit alcohol dehydrogenase family)/aryl carrier-like protein [Xanthomonas arboricola]
LALWVQGVPVDWRGLHAGRTPRRVSLPTYPFAPEHYWVPGVPRPADRAVTGATPARRRRILAKQWQPSDLPAAAPSMHRVLIVADDTSSGLVTALRTRLPNGHAVTPGHFLTMPASTLGAYEGIIELATEPVADESSVRRLVPWQVWVRARAAQGGRALCVTRGLEEVHDTRPRDGTVWHAALVRGLQSEYTRLSTRHLDLDALMGDVEREAEWIHDEWLADTRDVQARRNEGIRYIATLEEALPPDAGDDRTHRFAPDEVLWITGGTRGLGYLCARHFVKRHGARRLLLTCREAFPLREQWPAIAAGKGPHAARVRDLLELEATGASIRVSNVALTDAVALGRELGEVVGTMGAIRGFIHCAGRLDANDPAFVGKSLDSIASVLQPKVDGLKNAFAQLHDQPLTFAALFSSVSALLPALAVGQSDYAAANAFMDHFAMTRAAAGEPVISVQWPSWAQTGMGAAHGRPYGESGLLSLDDDEGLALLDELLAAGYRGAVLPAWVDEDRWSTGPLRHAPAPAARKPSPGVVEAAPARAKTDTGIEAWLLTLVSGHLGIEPSRIDPLAPLTDYGADSVMLAQLLAPVGKAVGQVVDPSILYEHPTIAAFAGWLRRHHGKALEDVADPPHASVNTVTRPGDERPATLPAVRPTSTASRGGDVAVVGISCRFAGCDTLDAYWALLREGRSSIRPIAEQRWTDGGDDHAALLDDAARFDADYFRLSPYDARAMDPQALILLEESLKTWYHAGYLPDEIRGSRTGVYLGARSQHRADDESLGLAPNPILATGQNYLAANVSQFFDLRGPSLVVDTACSSALAAADLAVQALCSRRADSALVGGVNVLQTGAALALFRQRGLLQPEGRFHVFDRRAQGAILGEGAGMVLLKTLDRARADGDTIYAIVRATGINNDGRTAGPGAPNMHAQIDVMRDALAASGLRAEDVTHVEANGAGSPVSDLLELKAIAAVYGGLERRCELGSIKPNIGHPLCAEGIASFIKVVLMLHRRQRVPFLSAEQPLAHFDTDAAGLSFCRDHGAWESPLLAAAVNSFADGGTNAHVVLAAFDAIDYVPTRSPLEAPVLNRIDLATPIPAAVRAPEKRAKGNFWKEEPATSH